MTDNTATDTTYIDVEELRATVAEVLDVDSAEVTEDARYIEDLGVDSLLALEMQLAFEQVYGIELTEAEMRQAKSLRMTHELLNRKCSAK